MTTSAGMDVGRDVPGPAVGYVLVWRSPAGPVADVLPDLHPRLEGATSHAAYENARLGLGEGQRYEVAALTLLSSACPEGQWSEVRSEEVVPGDWHWELGPVAAVDLSDASGPDGTVEFRRAYGGYERVPVGEPTEVWRRPPTAGT